jgi:hypothetical protein
MHHWQRTFAVGMNNFKIQGVYIRGGVHDYRVDVVRAAGGEHLEHL